MSVPLGMKISLCVAPVIMILISIPLVLRKVKPNRWYGFRTPKTLSDETIWYKANRFSGFAFLINGIVLLLVVLMLGIFNPPDMNTWGVTFCIGLAVTLPINIAVSFIYLVKL